MQFKKKLKMFENPKKKHFKNITKKYQHKTKVIQLSIGLTYY